MSPLPRPMLADTHCHLASHRFEPDLEEVITRASGRGVDRIVAVGTDLEDSVRCVEIAERFPGVYAAVGIHPGSVHQVKDDGWRDRLRDLLGHPKVAALGETGLDYYHEPPTGIGREEHRSRQKDFLRGQLELAAETGLNVILHRRDRGSATQCREDLFAEVLPYSGPLRAVFHCWTDSWECAAPLIERGHLVSFTGIATFPGASTVHQALRDATAGSFMLETDAPYLAPVPHRGKRCEPGHVRDTCEAVAQLRGVSADEAGEATTRTAAEFFRWKPV